MKKYILDISKVNHAIHCYIRENEITTVDGKMLLDYIITGFINEYELPIIIENDTKPKPVYLRSIKDSVINVKFHIMATTYASLYKGISEIVRLNGFRDLIVADYEVTGSKLILTYKEDGDA